MITKTLVQATYKVEDTRTKRSIIVEHTDEHLYIKPKNGRKEFVFMSENTPKTKERWRNIARLIMRACDNT
jgi:hypothetical protein